MAKEVVIVVLKLILILLKKSGKTPVHRTKRISANKSDNTDNSFSSITSMTEPSLSSGIGSSINSNDSHSTSSQGKEEFKACSLENKIERLHIENQALREKLSQKQVEPRTSLSLAMRGPSRPTTSKDDIHDFVRENLKLKLELEKEENIRLQNYINDVMYMVLETRPGLLEK